MRFLFFHRVSNVDPTPALGESDRLKKMSPIFGVFSSKNGIIKCPLCPSVGMTPLARGDLDLTRIKNR